MLNITLEQKEKIDLLKNFKTMDQKVAIFIPSKIGNEEYLEYQKAKSETILTQFSILFGGATKESAVGGWIDYNTGQLIQENIIKVYSYTDKTTLECCLNKIIEIAEDIKKTLKQDAIGLEVNNSFILV